MTETHPESSDRRKSSRWKRKENKKFPYKRSTKIHDEKEKTR